MGNISTVKFLELYEPDNFVQQAKILNGEQQAVLLLDTVHMAILYEATGKMAPFNL
jgi:hypothetical protein